MWRAPLAALLLFTSTARPAAPAVAEPFSSPSRSVDLALYDLTRYRPAEDRVHLRYLSLYHMTADERRLMIRVLAVHVNSLSRGPVLRLPVVVYERLPNNLLVPALLRVDIRWFKWDKKVWERLAPENVYYNVTREAQVREKGKLVKKDVAVAARWLPREATRLVLLMTDSQTPIVRADWFFTQTVVQKNRVAGYYDWLGLKNRNDFFRLVGADYAKAAAAGREWGAVLQVSGVAQRNRQVVRFGVIDAALWFTKDVFRKQTRRKNAINFLANEFDHDAEEHIAPLPNGLFAYYLCDDKGVQQEVAPSDVGRDKRSTSNDPDIHAYLSCVRCHTEGLRPLDDYGRALYEGGVRLAVVKDFKKLELLEQLYIRPLERHMNRDVAEYEEVLKELGGPGLDPPELSRLYRLLFKRWHDDLVGVDQAARESGYFTAQELRSGLVTYSSLPEAGGMGRLLPGALLGFTKNDPGDMLREHWEEAFDAIHLIMDEVSEFRKRGRK